jgi:hypothetical protein
MPDERKPPKMGRPRIYEAPHSRLASNIDAELHQRFSRRAHELGRLQRHCLEEALRDWLRKQGQDPTW